MERKRNVFTINGKKTHDCQEEEEEGGEEDMKEREREWRIILNREGLSEKEMENEG